MRIRLSLILFIFPVFLQAQHGLETIKHYEDSIQLCFNKIINANDDSVKLFHNQRIIHLFNSVLAKNESFSYPFDSLLNMGKLTSPDKKIRLYNWNIQLRNGEFKYFGFLQVKSKEKNIINIYPLIDKSSELENTGNVTTSNKNWYGALYYQIIEVKDKKNKYYTLLGWDGNNDFTNKKIIEVLYFNKSEKPSFGKNIFKFENEKKKRVIFEYSYLASMALRYEETLQMIVYDHLAPSSPKFEGQYQYYGPDFSYDGLFFKNGKWTEEKNIDVRNPKSRGRKKKNISFTF
jgi:hypothetical protein